MSYISDNEESKIPRAKKSRIPAVKSKQCSAEELS
jgi:hypothetical protein